jgi:hypothetical protein
MSHRRPGTRGETSSRVPGRPCTATSPQFPRTLARIAFDERLNRTSGRTLIDERYRPECLGLNSPRAPHNGRNKGRDKPTWIFCAAVDQRTFVTAAKPIREHPRSNIVKCCPDTAQLFEELPHVKRSCCIVVNARRLVFDPQCPDIGVRNERSTLLTFEKPHAEFCAK